MLLDLLRERFGNIKTETIYSKYKPYTIIINPYNLQHHITINPWEHESYEDMFEKIVEIYEVDKLLGIIDN